MSADQPATAAVCAVEDCERPGVVRVTGSHSLPGREPLEIECLICREHGREFSGLGMPGIVSMSDE